MVHKKISKYKLELNIPLLYTDSDTKKVTTVVTGEIQGIPVPLPLSDPNACNHGVKCPVAAGSVNTYNESIYIDPSFPTVGLL